jgi:hypothetical protein
MLLVRLKHAGYGRCAMDKENGVHTDIFRGRGAFRLPIFIPPGIHLQYIQSYILSLLQIKKVFKKIFGPKNDNVSGGFRELHGKELMILTRLHVL